MFLTELLYIGILCLTLLFWDFMDFYIRLKQGTFLFTVPFWIFYIPRVFFSIIIMEGLFILNLLNIPSFMVAFLTPITFPIILQNLVVEIGGKEGKEFNIQGIFLEFKNAIIEDIQINKRLEIQNKLLGSSLQNDFLRQQCRLLLDTKFSILEDRLSQKDENVKRVVYIGALIKWGGIVYASKLLKGEK